MNKILVVVCAVALCFGALGADAQTPTVQPYFDGGSVLADCPPDGGDPDENPVFGTLWIVAHNWNIWLTAIEYQIVYPAQMVFEGDFYDDANMLKDGSSPLGVSFAWTTNPAAGWSDVLVQSVKFAWNCTDCSVQGILVTVQGHPASPEPNHVVRGVDWSTEDFVYGVGMSAIICPTVPVEETTWGGIKALYDN